MDASLNSRLLTLIALLLCASTSLFAQTDKIRRAGPDKVDNQYIVVLQDDVLPERVPDIARQLAAAHGAELKKVWSAAIKGFFAIMPDARAEAMSHDPKVKYVEENARMYLSSTMSTNINPGNCDPTVTTCTAMADNRLWHLDRADQNYADPNNSYSYCTTGNGVTIYVVDMGVVASHAEFGGRVQLGFNASNDNMPANDPCLGFAVPPTGLYSGLEQGLYTLEWQASGHGTAVASAAAGTRVGIAKNATIVPVKVSRCDQYSARYRLSSHLYVQNQTIFIVGQQGSISGYYRATNTGTSAVDDGTVAGSPFPTAAWVASWPVGTTSVPRPQRLDGDITWEFVPASDYQIAETVEMIIDGLNWILGVNTGPKSYAVVTLSTYERRIDPGVASPPADRANSLEDAIRSLLANNITVIASANNQNGNACDTSPSRLSRDNPDTAVANKVITAGGTMLLNRPWTASLSDPPAVDSQATVADGGNKGPEPTYDATKGVRDGRWICGAGDSDVCSNATATSTLAVTDSGYTGFTGGSNGGLCVTLFAPAKNLFLARNTGANDYRDARLHGGLASGTSWSAPIVAGFAARILEGNRFATPQQVYDTMMQNVSAGMLDADTLDPYDATGARIIGTPNKILRLADVNITVPPHSTPISTTGPTTFTVTAGGTTTVSYQWYQVNSTFDYTTYPRGAHSSTPIGTNSSTLQVTPATQTAYWVRVFNSCGSADSDIVLATPSVTPNPPASVVATASGATVTITWAASSGADGYRVERKVSSGSWQTAQTINSGTQTSVTDVPSSASGVVLYHVLARAGSNYSQPSNNDVAFVGTFTDDPVVTSSTLVRAENITELRRAVNGLLDLSGQAPVYAAGAIDPNAVRGLLIDHADFLTLIQNLNTARSFASLSAIAFRTAPAQGAGIYGTQIEDLRLGLK
jgi:hypothetical protein